MYRGTQLALEVLSAGGPGLLVAVNDVQWLDPASARAIGYALRGWSGPPVAVAVTWREGTPESIGLDTLPGGLTLVELAPLSSSETTRLVASHRPDATWPRVGFLARMSGGNPFYALELTRSAEHDVVPASLHEAAARRLAAARRAGRPAIELAAVVGPAPTRTYGDESLGEALDIAVEDHILVVDHLVRFDHPLLAWAAYEALPPGRRSALHRSAADRATSVEARARHLAKATTEPDLEVAALLYEAGAAAYERFAVEVAADFAAGAARLTDPTDLRGLARRYADLAWYRHELGGGGPVDS